MVFTRAPPLVRPPELEGVLCPEEPDVKVLQGVLHQVHGRHHGVTVYLHLQRPRDDTEPHVLVLVVKQNARDKLLAVLHVNLGNRGLVTQVCDRLELQRVPQQVHVPHVVVQRLVRADGAGFHNFGVNHRLNAVRQQQHVVPLLNLLGVPLDHGEHLPSSTGAELSEHLSPVLHELLEVHELLRSLRVGSQRGDDARGCQRCPARRRGDRVDFEPGFRCVDRGHSRGRRRGLSDPVGAPSVARGPQVSPGVPRRDIPRIVTGARLRGANGHASLPPRGAGSTTASPVCDVWRP